MEKNNNMGSSIWVLYATIVGKKHLRKAVILELLEKVKQKMW